MRLKLYSLTGQPARIAGEVVAAFKPGSMGVSGGGVPGPEFQDNRYTDSDGYATIPYALGTVAVEPASIRIIDVAGRQIRSLTVPTGKGRGPLGWRRRGWQSGQEWRLPGLCDL